MTITGIILASLGILIGLWGLCIDITTRGVAESSILPYFVGWVLSGVGAICLAIALFMR